MFTTATQCLVLGMAWAATGTALAYEVAQGAAVASRNGGPDIVADPNDPSSLSLDSPFLIGARDGFVPNTTYPRAEASGVVPAWVFVPLEPGATAVPDNQYATTVQPGWPHPDGFPVLSLYVRTPGSRDAKTPSLMAQAPFPTGAGMGLVGLALALGVTGVRRYRLSID